MYNFEISEEERTRTLNYSFDWKFPCQFKYTDHNSEKELIAYFIIYNQTLHATNFLNNKAQSMKKDIELLSLKIALDNAILEYRALKDGIN